MKAVIGIADDIVVHGKDDEEHDRRLHNLMQVAREHGLIFNREKCECENHFSHLLWYCLQQGQSPPRPQEGRNYPQDAST